ncbi:MAG: tetratricopeptide repeat protein [Chitinispirillaceae bacterium]|nr:tetratricopeptide repeat protein [Chitinispirillaceae bacterium]
MKRPFRIVLLCFIVLGFFMGDLYAQSTEELMNTGQELVRRGGFSQAVNAFRKVLAREPDFFEAQFNLAFTYLQWGRYSEAVTEFKKAARMQPNNSEVWSNMAIAYDNLNRPNDATDALYQAVKCDPSNITARMNLAAMYANANRNKQAIDQYKEVIRMDGTKGEAYLNLSKSLIAVNKVQEAKQYLKQAIVNDPNNGEPHSELGTIYWKHDNDIDKGIAEYRRAISVEPTNPAHYDNLANALVKKGQEKEAIENWEKAMIYIDDALQKEKIQDRIDRLQKGPASTASSKTEGSGAESGAKLKEQTKDLERELRRTERTSSRRIETKPVDVSGDFADMAADTSSGWDLQKEAKKRAAEKKSGK